MFPVEQTDKTFIKTCDGEIGIVLKRLVNYVICMLKRNLKKEKKEWIFVNNVRDVAEPEEF